MGVDKEFAFSREDFTQIKEKLYRMTGIKLSDSKDSLVYSRLSRRLRKLQLADFQSYLRFLNKNQAEEESFINALTTNLTSFYREPHHFPLLKQYLLTHPGKKRIWCAASSTGEEPYSIAMTVAEAYQSFDTPVEIVASDIDSAVLAHAGNGEYKLSDIKEIDLKKRKQFFYKGVKNKSGMVRVVPELRKMVSFRQINLTDKNWHIEPQIDVLFCRNVMIYFDKQTQQKILERMVALMPRDGLYVAGHSENFGHLGHIVTPIGQTIYQPLKGT